MKRTILSLLLLPFLFGSCQRCREYPSKAIYLPYSTPTTLQFKNEEGELFESEVYGKKSEKDIHPWGCKCTCDFSMENTFFIENGGGGQMSVDEPARLYEISLNLCSNKFSMSWEKSLPDTLRVPHEEDATKFAVLVKHKGIVSFYDKNKDCTWELVEK